MVAACAIGTEFVRTSIIHELKECFTLSDHAEISASAGLDSRKPFFEIGHFRLKALVSLFELDIFLLLERNGFPQFPNMREPIRT